jgi:hypothetical protein
MEGGRQEGREIDVVKGRKVEVGRWALERQAVVGPVGCTFKMRLTFNDYFF